MIFKKKWVGSGLVLITNLVFAQAPLKILVALGGFPLLPETFILNHITGLIDRGHNVTIHASTFSSNKKVHPKIQEYDLLHKVYYGNFPPDLETYDIILCEFGPQGAKFIQLKEQRKFKAKIITCFRGYDISRYVRQKGRGCYARLFSKGDLFLPVCSYFKSLLIKMRCDFKKIVIHPSAIDLNKFQLRTDFSNEKNKVRILSVNRLVEKKGTIYAIQAVARLIKKYPNIEYVILGDGELREKLNREIRRLGAQNNIKLLGWGNQDDVIRELNKADIFVLPSVTASDGNEEGIPNSLKEAMAVGLPVVSTKHAGIVELLQDKVSGFLVKQREVQVLADQIEQLILNPQLRRNMGSAGRIEVEKTYDNEKLNDRLEELLYKVVMSD